MIYLLASLICLSATTALPKDPLAAALALYDTMTCGPGLTLTDEAVPHLRDVAEVSRFLESRAHARWIQEPAKAPHGMFIGIFPCRTRDKQHGIAFEMVKVLNTEEISFFETQVLKIYFQMMQEWAVRPTGTRDWTSDFAEPWSVDWYDRMNGVTPAVVKTRLIYNLDLITRGNFATCVRRLLAWDDDARAKWFP